MTIADTDSLPPTGLSERAARPRVLRLHAEDNVIVAIDPILPGAVAEGLTAVGRVPKGHKMATRAVAEGEPVLKFGQIIGFAKHGFHFFHFFLPHGVPWFLAWLIIPIEILSYLSRPVSLSLRLFANMTAGHTMMKVFAGFIFALGVAGVAPLVMVVALTGLEIIIAFLQAYVFAILTCVYLNDALHMH